MTSTLARPTSLLSTKAVVAIEAMRPGDSVLIVDELTCFSFRADRYRDRRFHETGRSDVIDIAREVLDHMPLLVAGYISQCDSSLEAYEYERNLVGPSVPELFRGLLDEQSVPMEPCIAPCLAAASYFKAATVIIGTLHPSRLARLFLYKGLPA